MIKRISAATCIDSVVQMFRTHIQEPKYKYFSSSTYWEPVLSVKKYQYAFVQNDSVVGYMEVEIDDTKALRHPCVISFRDGFTAGRVLQLFIDTIIELLLEYGYRKCVFDICSSSPHLELFERQIELHGGLMIGYEQSARYYAGKIQSVIFWELMREHAI
jgi:hypothetical protein